MSFLSSSLLNLVKMATTTSTTVKTVYRDGKKIEVKTVTITKPDVRKTVQYFYFLLSSQSYTLSQVMPSTVSGSDEILVRKTQTRKLLLFSHFGNLMTNFPCMNCSTFLIGSQDNGDICRGTRGGGGHAER